MQKKILWAVLAGFVLGVLWLVGIRYFSYKNNNVHYHANFALYVNGQQDKFDNFTFYEEVQSCGSDEVDNPRTRAHLHGNVSSVVHVHDNAVTWGHFFANLGYSLSNNALENDDAVYVDGEGGELSFWLNGKAVDGVANQPIRSEDVLLINYGNDDEATLQQRYNAITADAGDYNERNDPSSCAGTEPVTFWERLKIATGLSN